MQPVIKLEVTVPHIALSLRGNQVEERAEADQQDSSERLRILPLGQQSGTTSGQYSEFAPALSYDQKSPRREVGSCCKSCVCIQHHASGETGQSRLDNSGRVIILHLLSSFAAQVTLSRQRRHTVLPTL